MNGPDPAHISGHRRRRAVVSGRTLLAALLLTLALTSRGDAFLGILTQLPGTAGCVSEDGTGGACVDRRALDGVTGVTVSPDGKNVYVAAEISGAVAIFTRNKATGALTQLPATAGCVSEDGTGGACVDGRALVSAASVTVSPDGRNVYVSSNVSNAVAVFARNRLRSPFVALRADMMPMISSPFTSP